MVKYKVLKQFRDVHSDEIYTVNNVIEMTVKRAEEVEENLDNTYLERLEEKKENENKK